MVGITQPYTRRDFIKTDALTVGAASALSVGKTNPAHAADTSKGLSISMAGYKFDRTKAFVES